MTVHSAKGLEAPIVLHGRPTEDKTDDSPWIVANGVDFLRTDEGCQAEARNRRAEDLRLRYVALTRAQTHQVFQDPSSPLAVPELSPEEWRALAPREIAEGKPLAPELGTAVDGLEKRHPWVESHSGLWRRAIRDEAETRTVWDRLRVHRDDEGPVVETPSVEPLPAGPAFGDLVHDILEAVDYRGWNSQASLDLQKRATQVVENHCQRHRASFRGRDLSRPLGEWLSRALRQPFALGPGTAPAVFAALAPEDTRREIEFHLPLAVEELRTFDWGGRGFAVHRGFLTGRIDLLFRWEGRLYLADWKTNRLGPGQDPQEVMAEAGYDLQAQWYWEALSRLAVLQDEPLEPGGVLYVFLRGDGDQARGIFLDPERLRANTTLTPFFPEAAHA